MAAAQRKRWAAMKEPQQTASQPATKRRQLSAEGRKRIIEATKKRWATYKAKKENLRTLSGAGPTAVRGNAYRHDSLLCSELGFTDPIINRAVAWYEMKNLRDNSIRTGVLILVGQSCSAIITPNGAIWRY